MPRVTCRCGEKLKVGPDGPERIDCPKCGAKIRLRRSAPMEQTTGRAGDGFIRFLCPCGRRLKVPAADRPVAGKCPDCGRVVPVPTTAQATLAGAGSQRGPQSDPEARTEELDADDLAQLEAWGVRCAANSNQHAGPLSTATGLHAIASGTEPNANLGFIAPGMSPASEVKFEAGLRVCPRCKKPVHLGAATCRECGTPVPRQ
jgi:hypothetical protein